MDLISRREAIDALAVYIRNVDRVYSTGKLSADDCKDAAKSVLDELPSAQSENTDCEYCHDDSDGYVKPIEKNCHAFIRFGMDGWELNLHAKGWHGSAKIMYCPMCGRELKHE